MPSGWLWYTSFGMLAMKHGGVIVMPSVYSIGMMFMVSQSLLVGLC
jgi:hypothetical protein